MAMPAVATFAVAALVVAVEAADDVEELPDEVVPVAVLVPEVLSVVESVRFELELETGAAVVLALEVLTTVLVDDGTSEVEVEVTPAELLV